MSAYSTRILQDSPAYYFKIDNSTVDSAGSVTPTVTTGGSNTFYTTGGVNNSGYIYVGATSGSGYGFSFSDTTAIFNDRTFTIEGFFKVASADMTSGAKWLFHTGDTQNGVYLQKTDKLYVVGLFNGTQVDSSAITVAYDQWTHFAVVVNTSTMKLYINGTEVGSATTPASISMDSAAKYFMQSTTNRAGIKGNFDELSVFNSALSSTIIGEHFAAFADANVSSSVLTSSGLFVNPTITVEKNNSYSASPMTASAASGDHFASTVYFPTTLDSYLASLSLEQRFKFDLLSPSNLGTGGATTLFKFGNPIIMGVGPDGYPVTEFYGDSDAASYSQTTSTIFTPEVSDNDFTIGVWFKFVSDFGTQSKTIMSFTGSSTHDEITIGVSNEKLIYRYETSSGDNSHTSTADVVDGNWHFAAIRHTGTSLTYYLDGSSIHTATTTGSRNTPTVLGFGFGGTTGNTKKWYLSNAFISTAATIGSTEVSNIWTAGTHQIQGNAFLPMPAFKNNTAYNDYTETLNPIYNIRFNESTGLPINYGSSSGYTGLYIYGSAYSTKQTSKNNHAYKFTNYNTAIGEGYNIGSGFSDNTKTVSIYAKLIQPTTDEIIYLDGAFGYGQGFWLNSYLGGVQFIFAPTGSYGDWKIITAGTSYFGDWHLYTMVRDGSDMKFFVDGKQIGSTQTITGYDLTNTGPFYVGGGETIWYGYSAATTEKYLDELQIFDYALTQQQIFEMYRSITIDGPSATTSLFVHPSISAGFGPTVSAAPATASGLFVDPTQQDEINPTIAPMTAFGTFVHPNYEAIDNVSNAADPMTASATAENPVISVNEVLGVLHMEASAEMGDHEVLIPGRVNANPMIANPATMVHPAFTSTLGALIRPTAFTASAAMPIPPAYFLLTDDPYYVRLFAQHAQQNIQDAFITSTTGNQATTEVAHTFLKFFDDVTEPITIGSGRYLENELQDKIFQDPGSTDTDKDQIIPSIGASLEPTPKVSLGFFDDVQRKAVRLENIEFSLPEQKYNSQRQFSLEFTFKSTKANQIISKGFWQSFTGTQGQYSALGLYDGKIYVGALNKGTGDRTVHPLNPALTSDKYFLGNKLVNDGQWHHIVIQYGWEDNRIQIWIDGQLDRQFIANVRLARLNVIGSNNTGTNYQADFYTSAWSYDPQAFISNRDITLNYFKSLKSSPIEAEPMTASLNIGQGTRGEGNRGRALLLYWKPINNEFGSTDSTTSVDNGQYGYFDEPTFDNSVLTIDYNQDPPREWYGWDLYPVDINGYYVSDLVKEEAYGGSQNIIPDQTFSYYLTGQSAPNKTFKVNRRGYFRDNVTDARRYIDLINDIDLGQFDAIMFRNYPDQSGEIDQVAGAEVSDSYFNLREKKLYEDFVASLRAAVDTGVSLFISNSQLALDMGIIDGYEEISDLTDVDIDNDPYSPTQATASAAALSSGVWLDTWKNNKLRVVNTLPGLTDDASYIWKDTMYFQNDDEVSFGDPSRDFDSYEYRSNGLAVGDEFIISDFNANWPIKYKAVPFNHVKAGTVITGFSNTYRNGTAEIVNPYRDYATSIALPAGTILNGTALGGKIFVNFTESFNPRTQASNARKHNGATDYGLVDLIQDSWIEVAFANGVITAAERVELLASPNNLDRQLAAGTITQSEYNKAVRWDLNGMNVLAQRISLDAKVVADTNEANNKFLKTKVNKSGVASTSAVYYSTTQFFTFKFARRFRTMVIDTPSMLTRGLRWLSNRVVDEGLVNRTQATTASAIMINPSVVVDKQASYGAQVMLASGYIVEAFGDDQTAAGIAALPFTADARFGEFTKNINAAVMTATALLKEPRTIAVEIDEIVVYIHHVDPVLYVREDIIK